MSSWIKFSLFRKKERNSNPFTRRRVNKITYPQFRTVLYPHGGNDNKEEKHEK